MNWSEEALATLPVKAVRYFESVGSTNDEAIRWAMEGAPDIALVVANEQTSGRGRLHRRWYTPAGAGLAFSLILRHVGQDVPEMHKTIPRITALGALAVCDALESLYPLKTEIKWPNDVLALGKKLSGILTEVEWRGNQLEAVILGIGINIARNSIPPDADITFPATCVAETLEQVSSKPYTVDRLQLLQAIVGKLLEWRPLLHSVIFTRAWEARLAFRGQWVRAFKGYQENASLEENLLAEGTVYGITPDGALQLLDANGSLIKLHAGEIRLRPVDNQ